MMLTTSQHANFKHGHSQGTPTYRSWQAMLDRCGNPNRKKHEAYRSKGIVVCERWHSFENFLSDMGERPAGMTLDRYPDNDGNYEPKNCRWATAREQRLNSSQVRWYTHNGDTKCLRDWCEHSGVKYETAIARLKRGLGFELAMAPKEPKKTHCMHGHLLAGTNLYTDPRGRRTCIQCRRRIDAQRRPSGTRKIRKAKA